MIRICSSAENSGIFIYLLLAGCVFFIYSIYCARTEIFHIHSNEYKPEPNYKASKSAKYQDFCKLYHKDKNKSVPKKYHACRVHK